MMQPKSVLLSLALLCGGSAVAAQSPTPPYLDPRAATEARITDLLGRMTLEEKIAALGTSTAVPRLGIPNAGNSEGLHGLMQRPFVERPGSPPIIPTTQFAQVVGMGQTWNPALIHRAGEVQGEEARWLYNSARYQRQALVVWGPNAELARDPRWGRIDESYGEDPFHAGTLAAAFVRGMQGGDPRYWRVAALVKHFVANSNENGRYSSSSDFPERQLHEYYAAPFRAAFVEGGARSYMAAYNAWNGVPMTVHPVLRDLVGGAWGVDGIVSTDAGAVRDLVTKHLRFRTRPEATAAALKAGTNQFLPLDPADLRTALTQGLVAEGDVDAALRGKYRTVLRLGLLDPPALVPYARNASDAEPWTSEAHKAVARQIARESIVLLKNAPANRPAGGEATGAAPLLPLRRDRLKSIAVFGSRANEVLLGFYSGEPPYRVGPLEGIRRKVGEGVQVRRPGTYADAAAEARAADVAIVITGNDPLCNRRIPTTLFSRDDARCEVPSDGMENSDRESLTLPEEELVKAVHAANPNTILVLAADFPYAITWSKEHLPAILLMSQNAQEAGTALADVLFGDYNPAGRTVVTWPRSLDQLPPMLDYDLRHGRTYMYFQGEPLFPFGYGVSYTTFSYSALRTSAPRMRPDGEVTVRVDVKNTGSIAGDEVVQLYVAHETSRVERPRQALRGFARVPLQPGEQRTVEFRLPAKSLGYWDERTRGFVVEEGAVTLRVGGSSADVRLTGSLTVGR